MNKASRIISQTGLPFTNPIAFRAKHDAAIQEYGTELFLQKWRDICKQLNSFAAILPDSAKFNADFKADKLSQFKIYTYPHPRKVFFKKLLLNNMAVLTNSIADLYHFEPFDYSIGILPIDQRYRKIHIKDNNRGSGNGLSIHFSPTHVEVFSSASWYNHFIMEGTKITSVTHGLTRLTGNSRYAYAKHYSNDNKVICYVGGNHNAATKLENLIYSMNIDLRHLDTEDMFMIKQCLLYN